jgi:hypothetical protein
MNKWLWSISTVVIVYSFVLAGLSILIAFPIELTQRALNHQGLRIIEYMQLLVGVGAIFWTFLLFAFLNWYQRKRNRQRLKNTQILLLDEYPDLSDCVQKLKEYGVYQQIEYRLTKLVLKAPEALAIKSTEGKRNIVLISTQFWNKFNQHSSALTAVLIHESAHLKNKDIRLLFNTKRLVLSALSVLTVYFVISLLSSISADYPPLSLEAVWASFIGKNYFLTALILVGLLLIVEKSMEGWREALADQAAIVFCGEASLREAERLLFGHHTSNINTSERSSEDQISKAVPLTPFWLLLIGITVPAIQSRFIGQFSQQILSNNFVSWTLTFEIIFAFLPYIGFFYPLAVLARHKIEKEENLVKSIGSNAFLIVIGSLLGIVVIENLPLSLPSLLMPNGYDYVHRVDVIPFVFLSSLSSVILHSGYVLAASFGAWISATRYQLWIGLIPGLVWSVFSRIEVYFFPGLLGGRLTVLVTVIVVVFLLIHNRRYVFQFIAPFKNYLLFVPLLLLVLLGWVGFGDVGHFAACAGSDGFIKMESNDINGAVASLRKATVYAPRHPESWASLSLALHKQGRLRESAKAMETAIAAPYNYHWSKKFELFVAAGNIRLELREPSDLELASAHFNEAERMWRNSSRFPTDQVAQLLYNMACLHALQGKNHVETVIYLLEASTLEPSMAKQALTDPDLSKLQLAGEEPPSPQEFEFFKALNDSSADKLRKLVQEGKINEEMLLRFAALIARSRK